MKLIGKKSGWRRTFQHFWINKENFASRCCKNEYVYVYVYIYISRCPFCQSSTHCRVISFCFDRIEKKLSLFQINKRWLWWLRFFDSIIIEKFFSVAIAMCTFIISNENKWMNAVLYADRNIYDTLRDKTR